MRTITFLIVFFLVIASVYSYCGDGVVDEDETQDVCCVDTGCQEGYSCTLNICMENIDEAGTQTILSMLLGGLFLFIFIMVGAALLKYFQYKTARLKDDYYQKVYTVRRLLTRDLKDMTEGELIEELKKRGYSEPYIHDARRLIQREKKIISKFA